MASGLIGMQMVRKNQREITKTVYEMASLLGGMRMVRLNMKDTTKMMCVSVETVLTNY